MAAKPPASSDLFLAQQVVLLRGRPAAVVAAGAASPGMVQVCLLRATGLRARLFLGGFSAAVFDLQSLRTKAWPRLPFFPDDDLL